MIISFKAYLGAAFEIMRFLHAFLWLVVAVGDILEGCQVYGVYGHASVSSPGPMRI